MIASSTLRFRPDRVARPSRSTFLTTLAVLALSPLAAQALDVQFEQIAKTGDLMPGRESLNVVFNGLVLQSNSNGELPGVLSRPSLNDSGAVVFRGTGSYAYNQNQYMTTGLYAKEVGQPLMRLVDNTTTFQVPGRPDGTYFADFDPPMLTNDGRVLFFAPLGGASSGSGFYWMHVSGGTIHKIVDSADQVPGWPGTTFSYGFRYPYAGPLLYISANDAGWAVFNGRFKRSGAQYEDAGLYGVNLDAGGPLMRLVDTTATMTPIGQSTQFWGLSQTEGPAVNSTGIVLFEGSLNSDRAGIFSVPVDGSALPTAQALQYQSVSVSSGSPRNLYAVFGGHDLNDNGDFVFQHAFGSGAGALNAVFAGNLAGGPLRSIIDGAGGYPVPGRAGATFANIYYAPLSNSGDLGIAAWDNSAGGGKGLYAVAHAGGTLNTVAASGQVPPGRDAPATITGFNDNGAAVNDLGNLAFAPSATAGGSTPLFGLYFFEKCSRQLQRVVDDATSTTAIPDGLGDCFAGLGGCSGGTDNRFIRIWQGGFARNGHYRAINNSNQIAFLTAFNSEKAGIYVANITSGGPVQIDVCPPDVTLGCPASIDPIHTGQPVASGCGTVHVTYADTTAVGCGDTSTITRTWTATNGASTATCVQTIRLVDGTPPVLTCPDDLTVPCDDNLASAYAAWLSSAGATDACGTPTLANNAPSTPVACGTTTVTWTATDACGNTATVIATFTIQDTTAPTIVAPAAVVVGVDAGACSASHVALGTPTTNDTCGAVTVANDAPAQFPLGDTTVRWTATDACGRVAYATQTVTVQNLAPLAEMSFQQLTDIGEQARVRLDASATSDAEHANADLTFTWILDGVTLASGVGLPYQTRTTDMAFGEHQVTLRVTDPCGGQGEKTVTLVLDPAELSLLDIKQTVVRFCTNPPRVNITGQIGLPLGVDFSELDPQIYARVVIAGVEILPTSLVALDTQGNQNQQWRYTNSAPHTPGVKLFRVNWAGDSYNYRDAGFPVELQSDLISTSETELELRNRNKRQIPGPFTLDIDGQASITLDPNFNVLASTGLTSDIEVPGKQITLTLPFPLTASAQFTFSGGLTRQFVAGDNLRASVGHYRLNVFFDEQLLPDGVFTWPQTLLLDLAVGTQPYPGTAGLPSETLIFDQHRCLWRTTECDEVDD